MQQPTVQQCLGSMLPMLSLHRQENLAKATTVRRPASSTAFNRHSVDLGLFSLYSVGSAQWPSSVHNRISSHIKGNNDHNILPQLRHLVKKSKIFEIFKIHSISISRYAPMPIMTNKRVLGVNSCISLILIRFTKMDALPIRLELSIYFFYQNIPSRNRNIVVWCSRRSGRWWMIDRLKR